MKNRDGSTSNELGLECPYCGYVHDPSSTDYLIYDEELEEFECNRCEKTFDVCAQHHWEWDAMPINRVDKRETEEK